MLRWCRTSLTGLPIFAKPSEYMMIMIEGDNETTLRRNREI